MPRATKRQQLAPLQSIGPIIERCPGDLRPWPNNPRRHPSRQISQLMVAIKAFGFTAPVLIDEAGVIMSGHGRVMAAMELKLPLIPTRAVTGWSQSQKRAFVISDNKLGMLSGWDPGLLKGEIQLLIAGDFNLELTSFTTAEIDVMDDDLSPSDPDGVRDEDVEAGIVVTRVGDCWCLGTHKLHCGDSLAQASYDTVLGSDAVQLVITDPPYNVKIHGNVSGSGKIKHREFAMASGEMSSPAFTEFLKISLAHVHGRCIPGAIVFVCMDWRHISELLGATAPLFGPPRQMCVWVKDNGGMGTFYRSQHELVFAFKKGEAPHINNFELGQHGRYRTNVWTYPGANSGGKKLLALHPTVKPVGLIADAIRDCSHRKGIVLDPFAGSGTILMAAERTGRCARAIELDPQYVDVAINRWQRLTGKQAVLASSGKTWDEVRAKRLDEPVELAR